MQLLSPKDGFVIKSCARFYAQQVHGNAGPVRELRSVTPFPKMLIVLLKFCCVHVCMHNTQVCGNAGPARELHSWLLGWRENIKAQEAEERAQAAAGIPRTGAAKGGVKNDE